MSNSLPTTSLGPVSSISIPPVGTLAVQVGSLAFPILGVDTTDATAYASDLLQDKTAYVRGSKISGTIPKVQPYTSQNTIYIPQGYIQTATSIVLSDSLSIAYRLQQATYQPGTQDIILSAGTYLQGDQIILGDQNLQASNITSGVTIFGVQGTLKPPMVQLGYFTSAGLFQAIQFSDSIIVPLGQPKALAVYTWKGLQISDSVAPVQSDSQSQSQSQSQSASYSLSQSQSQSQSQIQSDSSSWTYTGVILSTIDGRKETLYLYSGQSARYTEVTGNYALFAVSYGGYASNTVVGRDVPDYYATSPRMAVYNEGSADVVTVSKMGSLTVYEGGKISGVTVYNGGCVYVSSGGFADSVMLNSVASFVLYPGGSASNVSYVNSSCYTSIVVAPSTYLQGKNVYGSPFSMSNGSLISYTIPYFGVVRVSSGGLAQTVSTGQGAAWLQVYEGGVASDVRARYAFSLVVHSGGLAKDVIDDSAIGRYEVHVDTGGTVSNVTVTNNGFLYVSSGGSAVNVIKTQNAHIYSSQGAYITYTQ